MTKRLTLLIQIAHGLAVQFGENCEIVIHDLTTGDLEHSVVYVENGHITNRKVGDGPSQIVLKTLHDDPAKVQDRLSYLTKTESGRILKSSTIYSRGDNGQIDYIFSLNYDISPLMALEQAIHPLVATAQDENTPQNSSGVEQPQRITTNVNDLLDSLIEQALALVGKPIAAMSRDDKITVVQFLNDAGAFLITKSGDKVSSLLGISKFTLYNYMEIDKDKSE